MIRDSAVHDISKAAIGVSSAGVDGVIGHEAMLLTRGSNYLWLVGISGTQGLVASIDGSQFSEILRKALTPPDKMPAMLTTATRPPLTQAVPGAAPGIGAANCPKCGASNPAGAKFCAGCGTTMAAAAGGKKFCPKCGDPIKPGEKFCDKCGAKLA